MQSVIERRPGLAVHSLAVGAGDKETAGMGWSESYWDDVKSDLERLRAESEPAVDDGPPAEPTDVAGAGSPPGGPETRGVGAPADLPGGL